ncbi:MAG TPA: ATP-grasp domain-containing protein, partial [Gammaproteobacteria bacterium]|nr:ATP-grasp domain-containing protein [Gammaproteobacteria bacterium]
MRDPITMNLHEFQSKQLFADYGIATTLGKWVATPEQALAAARELGGASWIVKAQVHAGGRGKSGGVNRANSLDALQASVAGLLGTRLVTAQ